MVSFADLSQAISSTPASSIAIDGAEIIDWSSRGRFAAVTGGDEFLRILGFSSDLGSPELLLNQDLGADAQSVAVKGRWVAVAVSDDKTERGEVQLYRYNKKGRLKLKDTQEVGFLPDDIAWSGNSIVIANEGEPNDFYGTEDGVDPIGTISILGFEDGEVISNDELKFNKSGFTRSVLLANDVRLHGLSGSAKRELEPEFVAIDPAGEFAYVTLQENNAIARIDLGTKTIESVTGLGKKYWSQSGWVIDTSNEDGPDGDEFYNPGARDFYGFYMPDGMDVFTDGNGETYVVMANEGDARIRPDDVNFEAGSDGTFSFTKKDKGNAIAEVEDGLTGETLYVYEGKGGKNRTIFEAEEGDEFFLTMKYGAVADDDYYADEDRADDAADHGFAGSNDIVSGAGEGRLKLVVDQITSDTITGFGARSFSIRNTAGDLIWDSGDQLDRIAAMAGTYDDGRSDDKGIEPEHVEIAELAGRHFAFITFERSTGGSLIPVYEITDVTNPQHVHTLLAPDSDEPESSVFVKTSGSGGVLMVASEDSGTVDTFAFGLDML